MPMLIVDDDLFVSELNKLNGTKPATSNVVDMVKRGRNGSKEVPESLRKVISEEAIISGNSAKIAESFDISKSSVDSYKHGSTSTASYNEPDVELTQHNNDVRNQIVGSARGRLLSALESLTPEKLEAAKARDAASIAKDMSVVIKNMEPEIKSISENGPTFVLYAPQYRDEKSFDAIYAKDE